MSPRRNFVLLFAALPLLSGCQSGSVASFSIARSAAGPTSQPVAVIYASNGAVDIFSVPGHAKIGSITNGVSEPAGLWVDKAGRLYVANISGQNVTEYAPSTYSPMCTYNIPNGWPHYVTTDTQGHVYVTAYISAYTRANSYIYGYNQCGNLIKQYAWPRTGQFIERVGGVAVDATGNVFVRFSEGLEEFKTGAGFTPTSLSVQPPIGLPSALILDGNNNLISTDDAHSVWIMAPPYNTARVLVSGLYSPSGLSLNAAETRLSVVDYTQQTVKIYQYPSGTFITEFGASQGITAAIGVADSPDAVF